MASPYPDTDNPLDEIKSEFDSRSVGGLKNFLRKAVSKSPCLSGEHVRERKRPMKDFTETEKDDKKDGDLEFDRDDKTYDFSHPNRGLAIIINNEDFSKCRSKFDDRLGSSCDAESLCYSFDFLKFDVKRYDNLSKRKMKKRLKNAALEYNHEDSDCFVCVILTHGDWEWDRKGPGGRLEVLYGSDGKSIAIKTIVEMFSDEKCPALKDKPRMFFIQACRGTKFDPGQIILVEKPPPTFPLRHGRNQRGAKDSTQVEDSKPQRDARRKSLSSSVDPPQYQTSDATDAVEDDETDESSDDGLGTSDDGNASSSLTSDIPFSPAPLFKDCLIMYATPPGHVSCRDTSGTWFIQSLCQVIDSNLLQSTPLLNALTKVCGIVAREYQSVNREKPEKHGKKQVPVIVSMLAKDVFISSKPEAVPR